MSGSRESANSYNTAHMQAHAEVSLVPRLFGGGPKEPGYEANAEVQYSPQCLSQHSVCIVMCCVCCHSLPQQLLCGAAMGSALWNTTTAADST